MDRDSFRQAKKNMANTRRYRMKPGGVRQRCPVCGVRMTRAEATELGHCADCPDGQQLELPMPPEAS